MSSLTAKTAGFPAMSEKASDAVDLSFLDKGPDKYALAREKKLAKQRSMPVKKGIHQGDLLILLDECQCKW